MRLCFFQNICFWMLAELFFSVCADIFCRENSNGRWKKVLYFQPPCNCRCLIKTIFCAHLPKCSDYINAQILSTNSGQLEVSISIFIRAEAFEAIFPDKSMRLKLLFDFSPINQCFQWQLKRLVHHDIKNQYFFPQRRVYSLTVPWHKGVEHYRIPMNIHLIKRQYICKHI